ncbi:PHP family Zn ribbon phosphoesterase [Xanthomonas arboricola]|nr:PHP family Zn ribbon phosphoesterase [Xanthomonas sp. 3058]
MATYYKQDCPLCGTAAEYCFVDSSNRKYFDCPKCTAFQISKRAESLLVSEHPHRRSSYAAQAPLAPEDHLFVILMPSHAFRQTSDDPLETGFVSKSELPLHCQ